MPWSLPSTGTRFIWIFTLAATAIVATLSVITYRSAITEAVAQHSTQQLAMVRTAAAGVAGEVRSLSSQLRQFNGLPSVQNLDVPRLPQRVEASFGEAPSQVLAFIARVDAEGRLYTWTPKGEPIETGRRVQFRPETLQWASDPANRSTIRVQRGWAGREPAHHALVMPVWRSAPSIEVPNPTNEFNGIAALVIDLDRLVEVYLSPAMNELSDERLTVGLATQGFGLLMGPDIEGVRYTGGDQHQHGETQGTSILEDAGGRRLHAWAKLDAADESWLVASSASYDLVAGQMRRSALGQLALTVALLIAVPMAGVLVARRERRAQEEQRRLERQLAESQKMEAIGKLAGGVAHDFNNMLTAILGYASMIHDDAPAGSPVRDQAQQIRRAAESAASLTQKLLAFSRRQVLQADHLDFATMQDNLLSLIRRVIGETITVTTQSDADLWPILADPVQVEQSILNLAINARDAMPNGGTLQITARNAPRPLGEPRPDGDVKPGDYVQITVADTGIGMDDATRARMFEPFFTTKPQGQGTGLGLATVYGFIRQCGGHVNVVSEPGKGTTIELLLPRAVSATTPRPVKTADSAHHGMETVLVVEDEPGVRELAVQALRRNGYQVLTASSGEDALRVSAAFDGTIHLLLSDVVMPGMKGPELGRRLRATRPGIRVLLMSGYAADVVTRDDLAESTLVSKPFSQAALTKAVRHALDMTLPKMSVSQQ